MLGDTVTEDLKNIIASVCDGNIQPIKSIIEDSSLDEYVRAEALESLLILLNHRVISREELVFYFKQLLYGKLEVDYSYVWETLPRCCALIHPAGLEKDIEKAVADGKVMGIFADFDFVNRQLQRSIDEVLDELRSNEDYCFISENDVYFLENWVGGFSSEEDYDADYLFDDDNNEMEDEALGNLLGWMPKVPVRRENNVGRNDPCPCGSGKKYKKCCLGKVEND